MEQGETRHASRLTRREAIRRGAIVGGNLLWIAPAIQTLAPKAVASVSPMFACCECRTGAAGRRKCNAVDQPNCTVLPQGSTELDCANLCASQGRGFCFHQSATPLSCQPVSGGQNRTVCVS